MSEDRKKPQFGTRYLHDPDQVFQHNAWDDVEWDEDLKRMADEKIRANSQILVSSNEQGNISFHLPYCSYVGCGVGNTVFPILETNKDSNVCVYCCDFSEVAVNLVKNNPLFDAQKCHPFVCDISSDQFDVPFEENSLDYIILVFVLSAIHPEKMQSAISRLANYLKPGGQILFRDYGKYDMVELRFKPGRCLSEHFYVRGDGTRVFFFSEDEVDKLFTTAGLVKTQLYSSKRLQVNRGKHLKMYRIWIQAKYMKPL
nr:tRNA N(3)-methylcytidine methyltransferase METTL2 [Parasteatoda tepidariorum]